MGPGVCWRFVCSLLRHWHWWFSQGTFWDNVGIFVVFLWKPHGNVDFPTFLEPNAKVFTLGNLARKCNNQPENSFKLSEMYVAHETCLTFSKWLKVYHNQLFGHICPPWSWIRGNLLRKPLFWLEFGPSLVGFLAAPKQGQTGFRYLRHWARMISDCYATSHEPETALREKLQSRNTSLNMPNCVIDKHHNWYNKILICMLRVCTNEK